MRRSWRIDAISVIAATVLATAILAASVMTYSVSTNVPSAFAIWNDVDLVVFVPRQVLGSSGTVLEQLASPVSRWLGMGSFRPIQAFVNDGLVLRVDNGAVRTSTRAAWSARSTRPRFIDGRLFVFGGIWNGRDIDTIDQNEYLRRVASSEPDDPRGWHSQFLLERAGTLEVPVRVGGDALTLRATRGTDSATIDLVRDLEASIRLFEVRFAPHAVSAREFNALFHLRPRP